MTEKALPFSKLKETVLAILKDQGYMDSSLTITRRTYNRIQSFIDERGIDYYTVDVGKNYLDSLHVCEHTLSEYRSAVRRLDDYILGIPYRNFYSNPSNEVAEPFAVFLKDYLEECKNNGNRPSTVNMKKQTCTLFLNHIVLEGCSNLAELDTACVSKSLLIFSNKDKYADIRLFLKYLSDKGVTESDLSRVVPKFRRRKVLPTTYTPDEISKAEGSVNRDTDTGKRNIAIIQLATRMGLRSGDIAKLKWSEIDFSTGFISIIQEKTELPLSLMMPQEVADSLAAHLENIKCKSEDDYVFHIMRAPHSRITTSVIRHIVTNSLISAGIDISEKKHGPHAFRSSLATSMINDGASYETVRRILGHTDPNVIKHYAKTDLENLRLCAIEPPEPTGLFADYLAGKKVISHV